jgi:hypothetical protein
MPVWLKTLALFLALMAIFLFWRERVMAIIEFTITDPVVVNDEIEVKVSLIGLTGSSCLENRCYLQGTLKAEGGARYFGYTQNNQGEWCAYQSSPEIEEIKSIFFSFEHEEGNWSGNLKVKNNPDDENYLGPGNYELKIRRYSGKSKTESGESNTLMVVFTSLKPLLTPLPSSNSDSNSSPTPSSSTEETILSNQTPSPQPIAVTGATFLGKTLGEESTPAGFYPWEATEEIESQESTPNAKIKSIPPIIALLGIIFLLSAAVQFCYNRDGKGSSK